MIRRLTQKLIRNKTDIPYISQQELFDLKNQDFIKHIKEQIQEKGPMSFNNYMSKCLTDENHGYYMKRDKGDFITSPEISQMFGEMIGIWCINQFSQLDQKRFNKKEGKRLQILEFGPGRGTLMKDIVKVFQQLNQLNGIDFHFIEYSGFMQKLQQQNIQDYLNTQKIYLNVDINEKFPQFQSENTKINLDFNWFRTYDQFLNYQSKSMDKLMNAAPIIVIAHEFFDALPVNIFQFTDQGWHEVLINNKQNSDDPFEFILSEPYNQNVKKILKPEKLFSNQAKENLKINDKIEISPQSLIIANQIADLISKINGNGLFIDYGDNRFYSDSVRGIRNHKFVKDFLQYPGEVDLSAYVNFRAIQETGQQQENIIVSDAIPQGYFLESMGMNTRLDVLCQKVKKDHIQRLESEYLRLVSPDEMGETYKVQFMGQKKNGMAFPFIEQQQQIFY